MADAPHTTLDRVADEVVGLVRPERAPRAAALARASFRRADDLPPAAAQRVVSALSFLERRSSGTLAVRAFNPTPSTAGYSTEGTVLEVSVEDRPFLLTTVTEELKRLGLSTVVVLNPVVGVERNAGGSVVGIGSARNAEQREFLLHAELTRQLEDGRLHEVEDDLVGVLRDALAATGDFEEMRAQMEEAAFALRATAGSGYSREEVDETSALVRWLLDDHFILLGACEYERDDDVDDGKTAVRLRLREGSSLGILRDPRVARGTVDAETPRVLSGRLVSLTRTGRVSTVHRHVRMIAVSLRMLDDQGEVAGEHRVLGLFSQRAYAEPASTTPVLRRLLRRILEREDIVDRSSDERLLRALFEAFPKHELFAADEEDLRATLVALLDARRRQDVRVIGRADAEARVLSLLVALPQDRFNAVVRRRLQDLLTERFGATAVDYRLSLDEHDQALLQFALHVPEVDPAALDATRLDEIEREITRLTRSFTDELVDHLRRTVDPVEAARLSEAFVRRVGPSYTQTTPAHLAARDLTEVAALSRAAPVRLTLRQDPGDPPELQRLRLFKTGGAIELSDFLPILESLGLTVTVEVTHRLDAHDGQPVVHLHDFGVRADRDLFRAVAIDVERDGPRLAAAVLSVLRGHSEVDSLNRLILAAGLRWEDVEVLRTYRHYRRQVGTSFSSRFLDDALVANPEVAAALVSLFGARFDPAREADAEAEPRARARVLETLASVERFDEDRILRGFLGLMSASLRTNRYSPTRRGCLSLKFDSAQVPDMPRPVPAVEVFVAGPRVQGVHLRGGPVARGGLRASDRREDFRTEVLGLLKAQMTKNAVIVPTGSKGGFVLPRTILDPLAQRDAVLEAYQTFVRGLLDVTDNVRGGQVVPPAGVRRHDGDDAYLVVAADKGTAAFSDVANEISAEYGFWLGDAFASGGSSGYDHKAMGITARGAWVAVRRHFRELDVDVQSDPITVVGIGDMSGDVFGNGVLQSRSLRLVAAFDHRDIFVDPDPDPEVAFKERERLFRLANSSWRDYNRELISSGGGVWSRTQRAIPLSPQVRSLLRVDAESLPPPALIRAVLSAPVDLLFAGGIGTFVRATGESDLDVGDRANDAIRITAAELGARVVGEGGNLSMTQRARIQYARRGGRCNTDAIDNVGGVDTSDREVNLKILLQAAIEAGELTPEERDELLAAMTEDVAAAVLTDVDRQVAALTAEVVASPRLLEAYESLMADLVEAGRLDREVEALPDSAEMARRSDAGAGLARPELCVLLGYSKVDHVARLLSSDLPDEPWLRTALDTYFPPLAVEHFGHLISEHRLRRQLVATVVANDLVNRMGITYVSRTAHELGCMSWEVAAAWWAAREVSDGERLWQMIEGLGERVTVALELELEAEVDRLVDTLTRTYLRHRVGSDIGRVVARDRPAFDELAKAVDDVAPPARGASRTLRGRGWTDLGIESELAERIAALRELTIVPDVAVVAAETGAPVRHVGEVFWRLSEALPLDDLAARLGAVRTAGSWQYWQLRGLADELRELRVSGSAQVVAEHPDASPAEAVAAFLTERADARERVNVMLVALDRDTDGGLDALGVAVRTLRAALAPSRLPPPDPGPIGRPH